MSSNGLHVVPNKRRWSVRSAGALRASGTYDTQDEAVSAAMLRARSGHTELYIHGHDGRILERISFREEPVTTEG